MPKTKADGTLLDQDGDDAQDRVAAKDVRAVSLNEAIEETIRFHGFPAPGAILGVFMADWAFELLGHRERLGVIVETWLCIISGILTYVRLRHGRVRFLVVDHTKCAVTLFDRSTMEGARVQLDRTRLERHPVVRDWYLRRLSHDVPKRERYAPVLEQMLSLGRELLSYERVKVVGPPKDMTSPVVPCARCGELFVARDGDTCKTCRGERYFVRQDAAPTGGSSPA
jgi:formylmethanofuran dehydrogenase subunit E